MNRFLSGVASIISGVAIFVCYSLDCIKTTQETLALTNAVNFWDALKNKTYANADGFTFMKISAIIAMVLAGILILFGLLLIIQHFASRKSKSNLCLFNAITIIAFACACALVLIAAATMGDALSSEVLKTFTKPAIGLWIPLIISGLLGLLCLVYSVDLKKKKRR